MNKTNLLLVKTSVFLLLLLFFSLILDSVVAELPEFAKLNRISDGKKEIVYFGDSVVQSTAPNDTNKLMLGEMLNAELGNQSKVQAVTRGAYHPGIYEAFSEYICRLENKPKLAIAPVNLRLFGPAGERPRYQFKEEIDKLRADNTFSKLWIKFYYLFGQNSESGSLENWDWEQKFVYYKNASIGKVRDFLSVIKGTEDNLDELLRDRYRFNYVYNLDADHRHLRSLAKTNENLNACGIRLLVYITPIDYEEGIKYAGEEFKLILIENINVIKEVANREKIPILDFSMDLGSAIFDHGYSPNEHLNEFGRMAVAEKLSRWINDILPK